MHLLKYSQMKLKPSYEMMMLILFILYIVESKTVIYFFFVFKIILC